MQPILEETIYLDFIVSSSTGAAADADSTPTAEVFEDATDTAILTPTVTKRTSKTGNYRLPVACTAANGFEASKSYNVIISATVGGVAAKAKVASFQMRTYSSDNALRPTVASRTLDVSSTGEAGIDWANVGSPTTTLALTGTTLSTSPVAANVTQWLGTAAATPNTAGIPKVDLALYAGATVTVADGTAQAGSTTSITLASGASSVTDFYKGWRVTPVGGTGTANQPVLITAYNGTTKVATIPTVATAYDSTTQYVLDPPAPANVSKWLDGAPSALSSGLVQASGTFTLADGAITAAKFGTGAIDAPAFAQAAADKVWATSARLLTAGTNIVLAKGTGVTGFNDIAATAIVSGGAITTSSGAVSNVTTAATTTNLTNLPTAPTDWLSAAATSAAAVTKIQTGLATPTNITAGTITTVTNLTNLPTMPTDWLTAAGLKADAVAEIQSGLATSTALAALVTTVGSAGAGLTALAPASTALSTAVWTGTRAGFLDAAISGVSTGGVSASTIATAVWQDLLSGSDFSTVGSVGKLIKDDVTGPLATAASLATLTTTVGTAGAGLTGITGATLSSAYDPAKTAAQATNLATLATTVGSAGAGLTALAPASTALSTATWTGTKAGFLDSAISGVSTGGVSASTIATAVWQDLLGGSDFSTVGSVGKLLKDDVTGPVATASQIPANFTSGLFASSGVFSTGALANAPAGGSAPTAAQVRAEMDSNSTRLANLTGPAALASTALSTATWTAQKAGYLDAAVSSAATGGALTCTVAGGSTGSAVVVSGLPSGKDYVGQHLYHYPSAESRAISSQAYSSPNYTFTFAGSSGTASRPFTSVTTGDAVLPVP